MSTSASRKAAATIWALWQAGEAIADLPDDCKMTDESEGQESQIALTEIAGDSIRGWKIAATSAGGQNHINVPHPLEGPYLASKTHDTDAVLSMTGNHMAVAEAEFAFQFDQRVTPKPEPYTRDEVLGAVDSLMPSLELPDSRILNFREAGAAALLADCACARDCILGQKTNIDWKSYDLAQFEVKLMINDEIVTQGTGRDALGDPVTALLWLVNRLSGRGIAIEPGQFVTTGVCGLPSPIKSGDHVVSDLGIFGTASAILID